MSVEFRILVQDVSPLVVQASNRQITAAVGGWDRAAFEVA
jgi:hypothetical protein